MRIDNRALVEECKTGDKEALNLFYIRFAPLMLSVIRRYVSDPKDAEDILHDGFIVAFTRLESLRDFDKVDYWLATIMKNLALQFLHTQDLTTILREIPEVEDTPEIDDFLNLDTLESLITKLPAGYQKVFRLAILENKSHKEIAKLLGIAPNSSSSQLFHAKLMMRRLIADYKRQSGLLALLLLASVAGVMLWHENQRDVSDSRNLTVENIRIENESGIKEGNEDKPSSPSIPESTSARRAASTVAVIRPENIVRPAIAASADSIAIEENQSDSLIPADSGLIADSVPAVIPAEPYEEPYYAFHDDKIERYGKGNGNGWAVQLNVNLGIAGFDRSSSGNMSPGDDIWDPVNPPVEPDDPQDPATMTRAAAGRYHDYQNVSHHNHLPISLSITANKTLTKRLSIETGVSYTFLHTTFETKSAKSDCSWHYIGIPLKLNLSTFSSDRLRLYASLGAQVDFPVYSNADVTAIHSYSDLRPGKFNSSVVWSLSASYGISFTLSKRIDLFLEPTIQYHFNHHHEVPDTWTDNPYGFSLPIGLRFKW